MNIEDVKIGYVVTSSTAKGYIGAVLVTDYKGYPLEFQYTDPILPTKIQQVLYGIGLEKYIKVDVILDSLLKVISSQVDFLIVQDEELLNFKGSKIDIMRVSAAKKVVGDSDECIKVKETEYIIQPSASTGAVRIQLANAMNDADSRFNDICELVKETAKFIDIYEPLDRVYKSVELILNQEV